MNEPVQPMIRNRARGKNQEAVLAILAPETGVGRVGIEEATGLNRAKVVSALRGLLRRGDAVRARKGSAGKTTPYLWFKAPDAE